MPHLQNTNYHGATVDNATAEQLKNQPAGDLLRFERHGDRTVIQAKLPEKGRHDGRDYDIRINMNYFVRGMMRAVMDKNGSIDPAKVGELNQICTDLSMTAFYPEKLDRYPELLEKLDVPPERREDFEAFLHANGIPQTDSAKPSLLVSSACGPVAHLGREIESALIPYEAARSGKLGQEAQKCAAQSDAAYENVLQGYRDMANMDPEKETRILYPMDCIAFSGLTGAFVEQANEYKRHEAEKLYDGGRCDEAEFERRHLLRARPVDLIFDQKECGEDSKNCRYTAFADHHYLTLGVTLDGQERTIALENTAPPTGLLIHRPEIDRTGVGIYENAQQIADYHTRNNRAKQFDPHYYEEYDRAKQYKEQETRPITLPGKTCHRYIQLHTGPENYQLSDKKVAENLAKVMVVQTMMRGGERPEFNLDLIRRRAAALEKTPPFQAYVKEMGRERLCDTLTGRPTPNLVDALVGPRERYALKGDTRRELREMARGMASKGRSKEWNDLRNALESGDGSSLVVFDKVEAYLKGKKSVRKTQEGRDSFELAMKAVALAARDGDGVAKRRAQILADRVNEVRGARPGDEHYVSLERYAGAAEAQAPAAERQDGGVQLHAAP